MERRVPVHYVQDQPNHGVVGPKQPMTLPSWTRRWRRPGRNRYGQSADLVEDNGNGNSWRAHSSRLGHRRSAGVAPAARVIPQRIRWDEFMSKKRRKAGQSPRAESLQGTPAPRNVPQEVAYIIGRAQAHDGRCVSLGPLVWFSTPDGDAWMLDVEDAYALWLARDGTPQPVRILDSEHRCLI
jgi:hypothetical protein